MNSIDTLIKEFWRITSRRDASYVYDAEVVLTKIDSMITARDLPRIFDLFDDAVDRDELMFAVIHAAERWDDRTYCSSLLIAIENMHTRAPRWAVIIHKRILNNAVTTTAYRDSLRSATVPQKKIVKSILDQLFKENPEWRTKAAKLYSALDETRRPSPE